MDRRGPEAFEAYYRGLFGEDWPAIRSALQQGSRPVCRFRPEHAELLRRLWEEAGLPWEPLGWYSDAVWVPKDWERGQELPGYRERLFYVMNPSSLLPVLALDPRPGDRVLDACAGPGGKALFLSERVKGGRLVANEPSPARRARMGRVFREYGAEDVTVWGRKAETLYRSHPEAFDRILADVPCSSEGHLLRQPRLLARWSPARVRQLSRRQVAILSGLALALRPGGRLVYATCALTPEENESVVAAVLRRRNCLRLLAWPLPELPGSSGIRIAPDFPAEAVRRIWPHRDGMEPMFIAVFERR